MRPSPTLSPVLVPALLVALAACSSDDPTPSGPDVPQTATVEASATANVFSPATQQIARGGTVTWTFGTRPHNVVFAVVAGAPADVATSTSTQVARQFNTAGTFPYECTIHSGMAGTIVVP